MCMYKVYGKFLTRSMEKHILLNTVMFGNSIFSLEWAWKDCTYFLQPVKN